MGGKSKDPNKAAMRQQKKQMERLSGVSLPELEEYILQSPELVGRLEAEVLGDTKLGDIQTDTRLKENQMKALEGLTERAETGLTTEDKYAMEQMLGDVANQEKSQRANLERELMERGMDTSGLAITSKLQNQQASANAAREKAMQMAMGASQQKQQALANLAQQSGQMESADYSRQAQTASARDAIARANAMNKQNVSAQNLAAEQSIANQRTNIANQQAQVANQIQQQQFSNKMSKAGAQGNVVNAMTNIAANTPQSPSGLQKLGTLAGGVAGAYFTKTPKGALAGAQAGSNIGAGLSAEDGAIVPVKGKESKSKFGLEEIEEIGEMTEGLNKQEKRKPLNLGDFNVTLPENNLNVIGPSEFANPYAQSRFQNGGINLPELKKHSPTKYAEDGSLLFESDGEGDVVEGDSFDRDRVDARLNSGEAVLNVAQQQRLMDLIKGEISPNELPDEDIVEGVPRDYQEELTDNIDNGSDAESKGFKKLLQMLGK